jgi:pepF/M3 family oligoendopeptidase
MESIETLPRWRLDSLYPALDSARYLADRERFRRELAQLESLLDALPLAGPIEAQVAPFERTLALLDGLSGLHQTLATFLTGHAAADAFDDAAAAEQSSLRADASRLPLTRARLHAWLAGVDRVALLERSEVARAHRYLIDRASHAAHHLLPPEAEALAADLAPTGSGAWARLHSALIGRHSAPFDAPGLGRIEAGIGQLRNLQSDPDRQVRERALDAEMTLLGRHEVAFAAAMNAIKGEVDGLARRRGWRGALEQSLFQNDLSADALEAMHLACRDAFPDLRRYLRAKARFLGLDTLTWHDLLAPVTIGPERRFGWDEATRFVIERFRDYGEPLAALAERAVAEGWIDVGARPGKRNGAFCAGAALRSESRILLNFGGTLDDVFTLAHELGHAYHNDVRYRRGRGPLRASTPMTLAETASIFCETVVVNALLDETEGPERLAVLEQDLLGATQLVIDIHSRFLFERTVVEQRRDHELSTEELRGIMLDAQAATYGDALASDGRHPLMWAHKGHYYSGERSFYNYPYTFGYLFGLGLYAEYMRRPERFGERYDDLLADTGTAGAATLAARFGIDLDDPDFWRASLAPLRTRAAEYEALVADALQEDTP